MEGLGEPRRQTRILRKCSDRPVIRVDHRRRGLKDYLRGAAGDDSEREHPDHCRTGRTTPGMDRVNDNLRGRHRSPDLAVDRLHELVLEIAREGQELTHDALAVAGAVEPPERVELADGGMGHELP